MTRSWRHQPKPAGPVSDIEAVLRRRIPDYDVKATEVRAAVMASALVRRMRAQARLSQTALAQRLHISQARVSEIESGRGTQGATLDLILRISNACGVRLSLTVEPPVAKPVIKHEAAVASMLKL